MKRIISLFLVLILLLCSCSFSGINDMQITVKVSDPNALREYNYYTFCNSDSAALLELLGDYEYNEGLCQCIPEYEIYIGDSEERSYGINIDDEDSYIRVGQYQSKIAEEDLQTIKKIFGDQLNKENYVPVEEYENGTTISIRNGSEYTEYTFKNDDSAKLLLILSNLEFNKQDTPIVNTEYKIKLDCKLYYRFGFSDYSLTVTSFDNTVANITQSEADEIKNIIANNCVEKNIIENEYSKNEFYVNVYGKQRIQYKFQNEDSEALINLLNSYIYSNIDCNCQRTYKAGYKTGLYSLDRFTVSMQSDGSVHVSLGESMHAILDKSEAELITELIQRNCTESNRNEPIYESISN